MAGGFAILWSYEVAAEHVEAFECVYRPDGDWSRLFASAPGYCGTELLKGANSRYVTIDRWRSAEDFEAFQRDFGAAYRAMDESCAGWTVAETLIGRFTGVGGAAPV